MGSTRKMGHGGKWRLTKKKIRREKQLPPCGRDDMRGESQKRDGDMKSPLQERV